MYLLDTDILIYSLKGHAKVIANLRKHVRSSLTISVVSVMELYFGAHKSAMPVANLARVKRIETAFDIIPAGVEIADTFGRLKAELERSGTPLDDFDLMIASSALAYSLILVTNNTKHFKRIKGLGIQNWAE